MQINLTLNKPATTALMGDENVTALKIKIDAGSGKVLIKPSKSEKGAGVFPLFERTRGGLGVTLSGKFAEQFLTQTGMERGTHMKLEPTSYNWFVAEAVEGKPSKVVPTARLWRAIDEVQSKDETAPTRAPRKASAARTTAVKAKSSTSKRASKSTVH
jgi:hypothetical protein